MKSSGNAITIQSYSDHLEAYALATQNAAPEYSKIWIDQALKSITARGKVLELGSAFGKDATYIATKGFNVVATDVVPGFVEFLQKAGHEARLLNALTDDFGTGYDMIFANAVFLHFTPDELEHVLQKAKRSLKSGGVLAFSVKKGEGTQWAQDKIDAPRYFCYWQKPDLEKIITQAGFNLVTCLEGTSRSAEWLQVIAKK